jgi:GNAT superfamily N-acetyltransferase
VSFPSGLTTRPPTSDDLGFVIKAWVRSYANSPWAGAMSRERQVAAIRGTIFDLLKRGAEVSLVCLEARPDFILGFICYEQTPDGPTVHSVYVKHGYRQNSIGSALVESIANNAKVRTSHRTPLGDLLFKGSQYNPRLSRYAGDAAKRDRAAEHSDDAGNHPGRSRLG